MNSNLNSAFARSIRHQVFESLCDTLEDGRKVFQIDYLDGHGVHYLWEQAKQIARSFEMRRDIVLWLLHHLLETKRIKLHQHGVLLDTSTEEQVDLFRKIWPLSEAKSGYEDFYWWFFDREIPAGIAWRRPDGSYKPAD